MDIICEEKKCYGCGACVAICDNGAISLEVNASGFAYPVISQKLCNDCEKCKNQCPANNVMSCNMGTKGIVASWSNNALTRRKSTSGGVFTELATAMLDQEGSVWGVAFNANLMTKHVKIESKEKLFKIQGVKYVQSNCVEAYKDIKNDLDADKRVLFCGTPCQVAGLGAFLQKSYSKLLTCDLVCSGVVSYKLFFKYRDYLEDKHKAKIDNIDFYNKDVSWENPQVQITFNNGKNYNCLTQTDPFCSYWNEGVALRESCYGCRFSQTRRVGDITLGNYLDYEPKKTREYAGDKGVSLVVLNSAKGVEFFKKIRNKTERTSRNMKSLVNSENYGISGMIDKPSGYNEFMNDLDTMSLKELKRKYHVYSKASFSAKFRYSNLGRKTYSIYRYMKFWLVDTFKRAFG